MKTRIRKVAVGAAVATIPFLTACSPFDIYIHTVGNPTTQMGVQVEARRGFDDGLGSMFAAQVVCEGENFVRTGAAVNVDNPGNAGSTAAFPNEVHWATIIWCPPAQPGQTKWAVLANYTRSFS